jgi:hypothetical protein
MVRESHPPGSPALSGAIPGHYGTEELTVARREGGALGGISLGGILVIVGIILMIVWSFWVGLIILLIGLIAFGGFARGKWY